MHMYNIVLIGDEGVGKETMVKAYIYSNLEVVAVTTILVDIWHIHYFWVESRLHEMHLAFTHTNVPTEGGKDDLLEHANAFVLVYSSVSAESFENLKKFVNETFKNPDSVCKVPLLLVATKVDLPDTEVQMEEGWAQAESWGIPFMEMSALDKEKLTMLFLKLVQSIDLTRRVLNTSKELLAQRDNICCCTLL